MAEDQYKEKTEPATPKKREEARKKGQVPRSKEVGTASIMLGAILFFYLAGSWMVMEVAKILREFLSAGGTMRFGEEAAYLLLANFIQRFLLLMAPLALTLVVIIFVSNILQGGFIFSTEAMSPKFSKINPVKGFKRLFSKTTVAELVKSLFKVVVLGYVAYITIRGELENVPVLVDKDGWQTMVYMGETVLKILIRSSWVLIILAIMDYIYKKWEHEEGLKMTKDEVKDELKQQEGDPHVRSRIRSMQLEIARRRMMAEVPEADVVITNPTSLAIVLKYDKNKGSAPVVVAKGAGIIADKIRSIAREHKVPIVEEKPLARALYKIVDIGREVPSELYHAVAEVLAYVYQLKAKRA